MRYSWGGSASDDKDGTFVINGAERVIVSQLCVPLVSIMALVTTSR